MTRLFLLYFQSCYLGPVALRPDLDLQGLYIDSQRSNSCARKLFCLSTDLMSCYRTGFLYDEKFTLHANEWFPNFPEKPARASSSYQRCCELGLVDRCKQIEVSDWKYLLLCFEEMGLYRNHVCSFFVANLGACCIGDYIHGHNYRYLTMLLQYSTVLLNCDTLVMHKCVLKLWNNLETWKCRFSAVVVNQELQNMHLYIQLIHGCILFDITVCVILFSEHSFQLPSGLQFSHIYK